MICPKCGSADTLQPIPQMNGHYQCQFDRIVTPAFPSVQLEIQGHTFHSDPVDVVTRKCNYVV